MRTRDDIGVYIGSGIGGLVTLHEQFTLLHDRGPDRISPFFINMMIIDGAPGIVSILTGARGPNWAAVSACAPVVTRLVRHGRRLGAAMQRR